jgi:Kef-type K+ transport system membrane component KefB
MGRFTVENGGVFVQAIDHLESQKALLQVRRRAARRDGILFVVLLASVWLVAFLISLTGYQPDARGLFLWLFLSLTDVILVSAKLAEYRTLKETLELVEVLQGAMEGEGQASPR